MQPSSRTQNFYPYFPIIEFKVYSIFGTRLQQIRDEPSQGPALYTWPKKKKTLFTNKKFEITYYRTVCLFYLLYCLHCYGKDLPTRAYETQAFARAWQMQVANK